MSHNNPIPVVVGLVPRQTAKGLGLLTIRRAIEPKKGTYVFPGGYVDANESAETAMTREMREETGLNIPAEHWRPVATRITPDNRMLIFMLCDLTRFEEAPRFNGSWQSASAVFKAWRARRHKKRLVHGKLKTNPEVDGFSTAYPGDSLGFPLHEELLNSTLWR